MRLAVPDLISPSYFPALAAVELGYLREAGVDAELELRFPVTEAAAALRDGEITFLAGAAHAALHAFPEWRGAKLLAALSHNMYWFLVVRADLDIGPGQLERLGGLRIGAAPGPDLGLWQMLVDAGVDPKRHNIAIMPVPGTEGAGVSFGVTAAAALADGRVDAFWANGMGALVAVRQGVGKVIVDARRDGGPAATYTFPALMATERTIAEHPDAVRAAVRGLMRAQADLVAEPELAASVGARLFPPMEAELITELVRRDAPYYDPVILPEHVTALTRFATSAGLPAGQPAFDDVVATEAAGLWSDMGASG